MNFREDWKENKKSFIQNNILKFLECLLKRFSIDVWKNDLVLTSEKRFGFDIWKTI
jgi:hypothetical protein